MTAFTFKRALGTVACAIAFLGVAPAAAQAVRPETTITAVTDGDSGSVLRDEDGSGTETLHVKFTVEPGIKAYYKLDAAAYVRDDEPQNSMYPRTGQHTVLVRGRDAVTNEYDLTPSKVVFKLCTKAETTGCGVISIDNGTTPPPADTDGDGVADSSDACPTVAGPASNNGCPVTPPADQDGDGVLDSADACPTVYGLGADGCPVAPPSGLTEGCTGGAGTFTTLTANTTYTNKKFTKCGLIVKGANITIQDSQIIGLGGTAAVENPDVQIYVNGAQNFKLLRSEVKDQAWEAGLYADGNATVTLQDNDFHDNGRVANRGHNVYLSKVASALVERNRFTGAKAFGVQIYPGVNNAVTVRHNWIESNGASGIVIGGDNASAVNNNNVTITDNAITGNTSYGIQNYRLNGTGNAFGGNYIWNNAGGNVYQITGTQTNSAPPGAWLVPPLRRYP